MRIGLIVDRLDYGVHGIGNYVYNLTKKMIEIDQENEYILIHVEKQSLQNPYHDIFDKTEELLIEAHDIIPIKYRKTVSKYVHMPKVLKNEYFDMVHEMSQLKPLPYIPTLKVITIHDIIYSLNSYPQKTSSFGKINKFIEYYTLKKLIKKPIHIIADSHRTKNDITENFDINSDRISVIHLGIDEIFKPLNNIENVKIKYGIKDPFILYVGALDQRKNVNGLIASFNNLKKTGIPHKLVIISTTKGHYYSDILIKIRKLNLENDVIFTGFIPFDDLPKMYNAADLFVFPSFYEGFGLPPLEAMACGCPVITSNTSSLPEVVGNAGIMVDPHDINWLSKTMYKVLNDDGLRKDMKKKGLERAGIFTWERAAKETMQVYKKFDK